MIRFKQFLTELGASFLGLKMHVIAGQHAGKSGVVVADDYRKRELKLDTRTETITVSINDVEFRG